MTGGRRPGSQSLSQIFAIPTMIGVASAIGLVVALLDDGWWDVIGWIGIGIAPAVTVACLWRRDRAG